MLRRALAFGALLVGLGLAAPARAQQLPIGLLPFDVVNVSGAAGDAGANLAKLVRLEMIRGRTLRPILLELPADAALPLDPSNAAQIGAGAGAALVVAGTVVDATQQHSSNRANTGALLSGFGVGGSVSKQTARVSLDIEVIDAATGQLVKTFEVEGKNTDVGVGMDFSSALGGLGVGDDAWEKSPMGKALREAARKVSEALTRVAKNRPK
ncbi:MAG TPA: CsgG/HfaB family protein [Vicinamibacterales bacterium]|nr:CsgG/HfaB family protein [Vicinamibacterales bacterium]